MIDAIPRRHFIGLTVSSTDINCWQSMLRQHLTSDVILPRWTHPDDGHVTLHFLGPLTHQGSIEVVDTVSHYLETLQLTKMVLSTQCIECFPAESPKVLAVVLECNTELTALHRLTSAGLMSLSMPIEKRPYRPHITLARLPRPALPLQAIDLNQKPVSVDGLRLYRSTGRPTGARYEALHVWQFE